MLKVQDLKVKYGMIEAIKGISFEVRDGEIVIDGETGCDIVIPCETVIDARDMLPNTELIDGLSIPCVAVGDCNAPYNIAEAIAAGNIAARRI